MLAAWRMLCDAIDLNAKAIESYRNGQGVAAFARTEYEMAWRTLEPLSVEIVRIGGTNAQREVFEDTLVEAYLRAGEFDRAESLLRRRPNSRASARDLVWLRRAQAR
jgi:hypothetical protein